MLPVDTRIMANAEAVAAEACRVIADAAHEAIRLRKVFRLVLAGGSTPGRTYQLLAATVQEWAAWEIFWGDERCLPADDSARNSHMAQDLWLSKVGIPSAQIHVIPAELGPEEAAAQYVHIVTSHQAFDMAVLGMGEDGHTASLFPQLISHFLDSGFRRNDGSGIDQDFSAASVIAVHDAPKPPAQRVSLNFQTLRACRQQLVLVTGAEKSAALAAWQKGEALPIARAVNRDACLLIDTAAASSTGILPLAL